MEKTAIHRPPTVSFGWNNRDEPAIVYLLPESVIETDQGPRPGVALSCAQARELGYAFLLMAEQLASGSVKLPDRPQKVVHTC